MRSFLRAAGWLCLIGLFGLGFSSNRNREIAASLSAASSLSRSWQLLASPGSQALARHELLVHQPEAPISSPGVAPSAGRPPEALIGGFSSRAGTDNKNRPNRTQAGRPHPEPASQSMPSGPPILQVVRLRIPSLRVDVQVVQVPFDQVTWDFASIQQEVAQLGSLTGEPTSRNVTLAGHVMVYNGGHGPFRYLHWLKSGDILIAETGRTIQSYLVREQIVVKPEDVSVTANTSAGQLTLITCTDWSEELSIYQRRRVVLADLVSIEPKRETKQ